MFTRRAGAGSAEARRAGATERGSMLGGPEQKLGSRARAGSFFHFIAPTPSHKHQALSALCRCRSDIATFSSRMRLTRSTKDRKKGCTYDPGALNKQGALKNRLYGITIIVSINVP